MKPSQSLTGHRQSLTFWLMSAPTGTWLMISAIRPELAADHEHAGLRHSTVV
jgi:hypothetical protein